MLCKEKKESIKSSTIGLYSLFKALRREDKITDQDYILGKIYLKRIEECTNLESTFLESTLKEGL